MSTTQSDVLALDEPGEITLPVVDVLTGRAFLTGKSGAGKSNSASVLAEELLDRGHPILIVDTDGEYWGLKEDYEILHVGADEECDLRVGPEHAQRLAELALDDHIPIILDVSGYLDPDTADSLVRETARSLFAKAKKRKQPFLLLVEEIHEYIPEGGGLDPVGEILVKIGKRGRKHGLGIAGMSQRPADVKKDFITQANWLLWHRLTWQNDVQVVRSVLGSEYAESIQDLDDGEAFLQADFLDRAVQRVQVRRKQTFDAGATPTLSAVERPTLKSVSSDLLGELEEISEREHRRQDRIAELEARLDDREETIEELEEELAQAQDMSAMAEQFSDALMQAAAGGEDSGAALQAKIEEIREEKNQRITALEAENETLREDLEELRAENTTLQERVDELSEYEHAVEHLDDLREGVERMAAALDLDTGGNTERLRERLQDKDDRINELEAELTRLQEASGGVQVPTDYQDFANDSDVQAAIEDAKANCSASPRYVKGVVAAIIQEGGPIDYATIAEYLGVSTKSDVSKASSALQARGVIKKTQERPARVDFDLDAVAEIKAKNRRRENAEAIMDDL